MDVRWPAVVGLAGGEADDRSAAASAGRPELVRASADEPRGAGGHAALIEGGKRQIALAERAIAAGVVCPELLDRLVRWRNALPQIAADIKATQELEQQQVQTAATGDRRRDWRCRGRTSWCPPSRSAPV